MIPALLFFLLTGAADVNEAVAAIRRGDLRGARATLERALAAGDRTAPVLHNLGVIEQSEGRHGEAIERLRAAIALDPSHAASHLLLGVSLQATGKIAEARRAYARAAEVAPADPQPHLRLALLAEQRRELPPALREWAAVQRLGGDDPEMAYQVARAWQRISVDAVERLNLASPGHARLYQLQAESLVRQNQFDRAAEAYGKALKADPKLSGSHLGRAWIHIRQGRREDAIREVDEELAISPGSAAALALKSRLAGVRP